MLFLLAGSALGLETNVGYTQAWRFYQVEDCDGVTGTDRGLNLGWTQQFRGAFLHSTTGIKWDNGRAKFSTGWIALDSVKLRRGVLGVTAGDNAMASTGPTEEAAASCLGLGARLRLGNDSLHVVAGRTTDSLGFWTFKRNQYLVGMEGTCSEDNVLASPYLVYRSDSDTGYSGLATGVETHLGIGPRVRVKAHTAVSSFEHRSARTTAAAGRLGCTYSYGRLASWGEFGTVGRGYLTPGAALHQDDRCDLGLGTHYSLGALTLTGAGSRYWSERARASGNQVGTAISLALPKLPVVTLDAGLRTGRDTSHEAKTFSTRAGAYRGVGWWSFGVWAEHDESLVTKNHVNTVEANIGFSPSRYLTGQVETGVSTGQSSLGQSSLTEYARAQATSDPLGWLQLTAGASIERNRLALDTSSVRTGQCGITFKPTSVLSLAGRFNVTGARRPSRLDSVTQFTTCELGVRPVNWLSFTGLLSAGSYELSQSRGRLFSAGATVGVILSRFIRADVGAEHRVRGNVRENKVGLGLSQSGDPTRLGLVWVSGRMYLDRDQNRTFGPGDQPLPNVRIMLNDSLAVTTGKDGGYRFPAPFGRFNVSYDPTTLPAYIGSQGTQRQVKVGFLGTTKVDFPIYEQGEITGYVYQDTNRNGIREPDEPGLPNIVVLLEDSYDRATVTGADGRYLLANLDPQTYKISIRNLPPDYEATTPAIQTIKVAPAHRVIVDFGLAPIPRPTIRKVFPPQ